MDISKCRVGDRVICIDNLMVEEDLTIGDIYIVKEVETYTDSDGDSYINGYFIWRFENIREYRRKKLEKIGRSSLIGNGYEGR